jgi:hypothetical protein
MQNRKEIIYKSCVNRSVPHKKWLKVVTHLQPEHLFSLKARIV